MSEQIGVPSREPAQSVSERSGKASRRRALIVTLLVALVIAGMGGGFLLVRRNSAPDTAAGFPTSAAPASPRGSSVMGQVSASASPSASATAMRVTKVVAGRDPFAELDVINRVEKASARAVEKAAAKRAASEEAAAASAKAANPVTSTDPAVSTSATASATADPTVMLPTSSTTPQSSSPTASSTTTAPVARTIRLVEAHPDTATAVVEVNAVSYDVAVGQVFAGSFQLQSVQTGSAEFLYGDRTISLSTGQTKTL